MDQLSVSSSGLSNAKQRMFGVSARMKEERKRLGLSQEAAANALGISVDSLYGYEKNKTTPPVSVLLPFSDIGADVLYIVTGERTASLLSSEEQQMIAALRAATPSVQKAILSMAQAGSDQTTATARSDEGAATNKPKSGTTQIFHGEVGQTIAGDINAKQTFKFKK